MFSLSNFKRVLKSHFFFVFLFQNLPNYSVLKPEKKGIERKKGKKEKKCD